MRKWGKGGFSFLLFGIVSVLLIPSVVQGEIYFGGMGGVSFPNELSNRSLSGDFPALPIPDAGLENSVVGGGKIGFYLDEFNLFGFETEGFFTEPEVEGGDGEKLRVITWAFNALLRYPGKRLQPYFGAGLGLFFSEVESDLPGPSLSDDWVPGLNLLGGVRGFLTDSIAVFAEYKFNYAKFDQKTTNYIVQLNRNITFGIKETYSTNIIVGGLSFHFN